jgi:hypothetical protein
MPLPQAATLILDGPTVEHALFSPGKLNLTPEDVLLVHGGSGHTGSLAIDMATALKIPILTYVRDEKTSELVRNRHPRADLYCIIREDHPDALRPAPVDDPEDLEKWHRAVDILVASVPEKYRPTKIMQHAGRPLSAADFRLLRPSARGSRTAWFSGAFGLFGTFNGYDAQLTAAEALGPDGADLRLGENVLIHYGVNADAEGRDDLAIEAITEAAHLGARVTVLAETQEQQNWLLRQESVAACFGKTRIQNVEAHRRGPLRPGARGPRELARQGRTDPLQHRDRERGEERIVPVQHKPLGTLGCDLGQRQAGPSGAQRGTFDRADRARCLRGDHLEADADLQPRPGLDGAADHPRPGQPGGLK